MNSATKVGEEDKKKHDCSAIFPSCEYLRSLSIETDLPCTVTGCDDRFSHSSALNFHLEKVHRINNKVHISTNIYLQQSTEYLFTHYVFRFLQIEKDDRLITKGKSRLQKLAEQCSCKYYCPIDGCKYSLATNKKSTKNSSSSTHKYFETFHSIKVHFIRVHGNKSFKCAKCDKFFAVKSDFDRHEPK